MKKWYRAMAWWQDERLESRYERLSATRLDQLAVTDNHGGKLTHGQLIHAAAELRDDLARHGIDKGDRILIVLPNRVEWQIALLATLQLQAIPASIPATTDINQPAYAIDLVKCSLVLTTPAAACAGAIAGTNSSPGLLTLEHGKRYQWHSLPDKANFPLPGPGTIDHIAFTSSTTGYPKAVMHSVNTLGALNQTFSERFSLGADRPIFMASPLGHSVGAYHGARLALFTGACLVLQDGWNAGKALEMIEQYGCAFTAAATPFLKDLVDVDWAGSSLKLDSLKSFLCGGAPVPPVLMEQSRCDLRGHGDTDLGNADGTLAQLGNDLADFLEAVTGPAACVGYSLGGTIVLWAAAMRPELVLHAVVAGTSVKVGYSANGFFQERIKLVENDKSAFAQALCRDTAAQFVSKGIDVEKLARKRLQSIHGGAGYINAAQAMMGLHDEPLTPLLERIRCPVDVIGADQDVFCPRKAAHMITEALTDVAYHEIAGAGHLMSVDQPVVYSDTLQKILYRRIT